MESEKEIINRPWKLIGKIALATIIVAIVLVVFKSSPDRSKATTSSIPVSVRKISPSAKNPTAVAFGNVVSSQEIVIQPEVSGRVMSVHPDLIAGGIIEKDQVLFEIDDSEYTARRDAALEMVAQAELALQLEEGQQAVAKKEWNLLNESKTLNSEGRKELALRFPHIKQRQAALISAKSKLKEAELDLQRCQVRAPFDALIIAKSIDVGSTVSANSNTLRITNSQKFYINVRVSYQLATALNALANNSRLKGEIIFSDKEPRTLKFIHPIRALDEGDRMVQLLFAIDDPLEPEPRSRPVLLGDYMKVNLVGQNNKLVLPIPNSAIYQNNTIWTVVDNKLQSLQITPLFFDDEYTYAEAPSAESISVVVSLLAYPLNGRDVTASSAEEGSDV